MLFRSCPILIRCGASCGQRPFRNSLCFDSKECSIHVCGSDVFCLSILSDLLIIYETSHGLHCTHSAFGCILPVREKTGLPYSGQTGLLLLHNPIFISYSFYCIYFASAQSEADFPYPKRTRIPSRSKKSIYGSAGRRSVINAVISSNLQKEMTASFPSLLLSAIRKTCVAR